MLLNEKLPSQVNHRFHLYATLEYKTPTETRFQNFCRSCVLSTDWIEIHQSQLLV